MTDTNDVNQQHLAAMGLEKIELGVSFTNYAGRCDSVNSVTGSRCAIRGGHTCNHARGRETWADDLATSPVVAGSVNFADVEQVHDLMIEAFKKSAGRSDFIRAMAQAVVDAYPGSDI